MIRGTALVFAAKLFFVVSSYGSLVLLPRLLATPAEFGRFATIMALIGVIDNVIVATSLQSVGYYVTQASMEARRVRQAGLRYQAGGAAVLAALLALLAPWIASALHDPALAPGLQVASLGVAAYGAYAVLLGVVNGQRRFARQAALDATFSALRFSGFVLGAWCLPQAVGPLLGFSLTIVAVALIAAAAQPKLAVAVGPTLGAGSWWRFAGPLALFQLGINALLLSDIAIFKARFALTLQQQGLSIAEAADHAGALAGYYRGAQSFAFVAYQLAVPLALTAFPVIARLRTGNPEALQSTLRNTLRAVWLGALGIALPISGASGALLSAIYPEGFEVAAVALRWLAPALALFAVFVVVATTLNALGHPVLCAGFAGAGWLLAALSQWLLLARPHEDAEALRNLALCTSAGVTVALLLAIAALQRLAQVSLPWRTLLAGLAAGAGAWLTSAQLAAPTLVGVLGALVGGGLSFVALSALLGGLQGSDLVALRRRS